jgi:hypothetical protein
MAFKLYTREEVIGVLYSVYGTANPAIVSAMNFIKRYAKLIRGEDGSFRLPVGIPMGDYLELSRIAKLAGEKRHAAFMEMGRFISECKKDRLMDIEIKHYRRRITVARVAFLDGPFDDGIYGVTTVRYGLATLNPDDTYNRVVGEYLALKKAFKEKIHPAVYSFVHGPCTCEPSCHCHKQ